MDRIHNISRQILIAVSLLFFLLHNIAHFFLNSENNVCMCIGCDIGNQLSLGPAKGLQVTNLFASALIGLILGALGAFLGIGGGPFNMAALYLFFSMPTKQAAENSLYVILISQIAGLLKTILSASVPVFAPLLLLGMIFCGILGSELGSRLNRRLNEKTASRAFETAMLLVMGLSVYNFCQFLF